MRHLLKPLLVVSLALAVPILPFAIAGSWFEESFSKLLRDSGDAGTMFALVVGVLATDVFLPVPSSGVGTLAGARLGIVLGTAATWIGTVAGAVIGFGLARRWGTWIAERLAGKEELTRMIGPAHRHGMWLLLVTRPLPILAEATVLLLGTTRLPWRSFWWPVMAANLVLAACYAALGDVALRHGWLTPAVVLALLVPLAAAGLVRRKL